MNVGDDVWLARGKRTSSSAGRSTSRVRATTRDAARAFDRDLLTRLHDLGAEVSARAQRFPQRRSRHVPARSRRGAARVPGAERAHPVLRHAGLQPGHRRHRTVSREAEHAARTSLVKARIVGNFYPAAGARAVERRRDRLADGPRELSRHGPAELRAHRFADGASVAARRRRSLLPTVGASLSRALRDQFGGSMDLFQIQSGALNDQRQRRDERRRPGRVQHALEHATRRREADQRPALPQLQHGALPARHGTEDKEQFRRHADFGNSIEGKLEYRFPFHRAGPALAARRPRPVGERAALRRDEQPARLRRDAAAVGPVALPLLVVLTTRVLLIANPAVAPWRATRSVARDALRRRDRCNVRRGAHGAQRGTRPRSRPPRGRDYDMVFTLGGDGTAMEVAGGARVEAASRSACSPAARATCSARALGIPRRVETCRARAARRRRAADRPRRRARASVRRGGRRGYRCGDGGGDAEVAEAPARRAGVHPHRHARPRCAP